MISEYVQAAMTRAKYELLPDGEGFYAEIPDFAGVYANADSLEECREQLIEVVEGWIISKLRHNDTDFPILNGIDFNPHSVEQEVA